MPNSFRVKLSKLRHKGSITNEDYQELKQKLDGHDARLRAEAIDEFVAFINTTPTIEEDDGYIRPMTVEEMAERLKEQKNE